MAILTHTKIGIAMFELVDPQVRIRSPLWALVIHDAEYEQGEVHMYRLIHVGGWALESRLASLAYLDDLIGVLHVANTSRTTSALDEYIRTSPIDRDGHDPAELSSWSCESWVIRLLADLHAQGVIVSLPDDANKLYEHAQARVLVLNSLREVLPFPVVPF